MARRRRTRRRAGGLIPWLAGRLWSGLRWGARHPQWWLAPALAAAAVMAGWAFATRSGAFRVTDVRLPAHPSFKLTEPLIGQNLWDIDLQSVAGSLSRQQPQLKLVRVARVLPNTIQIDVVQREPAAQVRLGPLWHAVDGDGFILQPGAESPLPELVAVKGAEDAKAPMRPGQLSRNARLLAGLRLIERLGRAQVLDGLRLVAVDVRDTQQLNAVLEQEIEIRFGGEDEMPAQVQRLRGVVRMLVKDPASVRYVDVRFADPVIGPRT